jgi:adenine-specific DNA-methyltransferase
LGLLLCDFWYDIDFQNTQNVGGISFPAGKKPEKLLQRLMRLFTKSADIVLDYHLGSGTTAAVAHKIGRKYIGIEQLNYGSNDSVVRLKNVIKGEQSGISKSTNWQGGGSFVYCELAKANQQFADDIEQASSTEELAVIWKQMQETGFLSWKVNPKEIDINAEDFANLSIEDQKRFLIECLDKNLLYVPYSEIDNAEFAISESDKKINNLFYQTK